MSFLKRVIEAMFTAGLATFALADNPISTYHYLADPGAAADDEYFYIITDSDDPAPYDAKGYSIKALYGFRSKDMQNWTDFGIIYDARKVDGVNDIWASGIAKNPNDGRLYIVFPDGGGGGIVLIGADSIAGPWTNPLRDNKRLIGWGGGAISGCDDIGWCFDPAIFFDDNGDGYFTFGGGTSDKRPAADNNNNIFNIYKLDKDMKSYNPNTKVELKIDGPKAMEASYIHKYKDNYYLSYSTADLRIAYGMSENPTGPYTYTGIFMGNPSINGQNINANNNNHHGIAEFKGRWYVAYHDRRIANGYNGLEKIPAEDGQANPNPEYHRSVSVDEMFYNQDGTIQELKFTNEGPEQIENFDPYDWYPALTSSKQKGIRSRSNWTLSRAAEHFLLPLSTKESWIRVSGVDFGAGATNFSVEAASAADGNKIEIRAGSATGTLAGTCNLINTGNKNSFETTTCEVSGLSGVVNQLFLVFKGNADSTMSIKYWGFKGSGVGPSVPKHTPYGEKAFELPGVIEAEHFDKGGSRNAYSDSDVENQGDANFRTEESVDIVLVDSTDVNKGMAIGYTSAGEWLRYTVNVKQAGKYKLSIIGASGIESGSTIQFKVDNKNVGGEIAISTGSWQVYEQFDASEEVELAAGEHVIQLNITSDYANIDKISIGGEFSTEPSTEKILFGIKLNAIENQKYKVYSIQGKLLGTLDLSAKSPAQALREAGFSRGVYMLKSKNKQFIATTEK